MKLHVLLHVRTMKLHVLLHVRTMKLHLVTSCQDNETSRVTSCQDNETSPCYIMSDKIQLHLEVPTKSCDEKKTFLFPSPSLLFKFMSPSICTAGGAGST
ncbi:hypothetical protein Bpfe_023301 [Biomphalaria pfeifferi]|uniref:Uncharacterized protein n=1 Tax=Biomphalaria pfeifferi TaxID=112525 RepID=A0AAD8B4F7_BIOPF|nr:hypothetical protein Bpfe_023301 [Biomphalaria pfeifferi]